MKCASSISETLKSHKLAPRYVGVPKLSSTYIFIRLREFWRTALRETSLWLFSRKPVFEAPLIHKTFCASLLLLLCFASAGYGQDENLYVGEENITETSLEADTFRVDEPVVKKIIFIDPGHGGEDFGVRSEKLLLEKTIALKIAEDIKKIFADHKNVEVIFSRNDDVETGVIERIDSANKIKADVFVSIHAGSAGVPFSVPFAIFINSKSESDTNSKNSFLLQNNGFDDENRKLAGLMLDSVERVTGRKGEIISSDKLFLGSLSMPALLIEAFDLSDPEEEIKLEDEKYIEDIATAIARSIERFMIFDGLL